MTDEDLAESAAYARRIAATTCRSDPRTGESCAWYHGLWQDLRAVGLGASVAYQSRFFADALALSTTRAPRLLVSGAADQAIARQMLATCDAQRIDPRVTVLDVCDTPLRLNERYAARIGRTLATVRADAFEHAPSDPYDVIVAHSFVGYFRPARRRTLVAHWASMLALGGVIAIVNRLRAGDPEVALSFGERERGPFLATVEARLRPLLTSEELSTQLARAERYVQSHRVHPLPEGELESAFAAAGMRVVLATMVTADDARSREVGGGVAVASNARYACIAAMRE